MKNEDSSNICSSVNDADEIPTYFADRLQCLQNRRSMRQHFENKPVQKREERPLSECRNRPLQIPKHDQHIIGDPGEAISAKTPQLYPIFIDCNYHIWKVNFLSRKKGKPDRIKKKKIRARYFPETRAINKNQLRSLEGKKK